MGISKGIPRAFLKCFVVPSNPKLVNISIAIAALFFGWTLIEMPRRGYSQSVDHTRESRQVEKYLQTLGLDRLLVEFLEIETSREVDPVARREKAARLARLYARQMISASRPNDANWQLKCELLLKTYPGLSTPTIRLAILQSRYLRGEASFDRWWETGADFGQNSRLIVQWQAIKTDLDALSKTLESEYQSDLAMAQVSSEHQPTVSNRLIRAEVQLLQTSYLMGWTAYFLGILTPDDRFELMVESDRHFREFLQIDPQKLLMEVSPSWIDFSSEWHVRALAGLAMCQRGLQRMEQSEFCFELIGNHAPDQRTRDSRFAWDLNGRLYLDDFSTFSEMISSVALDTSLSEVGRIIFWRTVLKSGVAVRAKSPDASRELMRWGLSGLARDFQASLISQFLEKNNFTADSDDFLGHWIAGYLKFSEAEVSNDESDYRDSRQHMARAIELGDASNDPLDVACCRYLLARIEFRQRDYENAARAFLEVSLACEARAPQLAVESQWLAIRSLSELHHQKPRVLFQVHQAIDQLLRRFPGSTYAQRAVFEKRRIDVASLPPEKAIIQLEQVKKNDPNYAASRFEILKIRFQSWLDSHLANGDRERQKRDELLKAGKEFQQIFQANQATQLKASLLLVDALLRDEQPDFSEIRILLDQAESYLNSGEKSPVSAAEFHYYQFLFASRSGRGTDAIDEANWISEHARGSRFEHSAMIQLAQAADRKIQSSTNPTDKQLLSAIAIYERLVELSGHSNEDLLTVANARIAFARLSELKIQSGQVKDGKEMLELLNQIFPHYQSYLHRLAIVRTDTGDFSAAIPLWRKLASGVESGTDIWFESKQQLAYCLYQVGDRVKARQLHTQTIKLSPDLPDRWRVPFDELSKLLESK